MKKIKLIVCLILFLNQFSIAQYSFEEYNRGIDTIQVFENGKKLKYPFTGGLNNPQYSTIDLNFDGLQDLVIFERECSRLTTFLNTGIPNQISYTYAPEYQKYFPQMTNWCLLIDYNGDGKNDIFCQHPSGVTVYKNISSPQTGLKFLRMTDYLKADYGTFVTNLIAQPQDIPAIIDIDNDGDLDIFSFGTSIDSSGESVYWFRNYSKERYNNIDSLEFDLEKECWGRFRESFTTCHISLIYPTGICGLGGKQNQLNNVGSSRHTGSTLLIFDANSDNKYDLLLGDISCSNAYLLLNGNNNFTPIMNQVLYSYPPNNPIDIVTFPAFFNVDVNNDGLKDLISAPNSGNGSINTNQIKLFLNNGAPNINKFDLVTNNFLTEEMIDVAEGSAPSFIDYNNDGLMDIVISNTGYWDTSNTYTTGLALYKNIGSTTLAKFELISRDWLGFSNLHIPNMAPCFGDLDNDGDLDMVCGANDGTLHFFRNNNSSTQTLDLQYIPNYFSQIDVGNFSTPFIFDFDKDGKKEIIIGEQNNNINLIGNSGSIQNPIYTTLTDSLYKIKLSNYLSYPTGRSRLSIEKLAKNDQPRIILSFANGTIYILDYFDPNYNNIHTKITDSIPLHSGIFSPKNGGFFYSFADLNNDSKPEIVIGNPQGGLYLYRNTSSNVGNQNDIKKLDVSVYPNPVSENIFVQSNGIEKIQHVQLFDISGKQILSIDEENTFYKIDTKNLSKGIYLLKVMGSASVNTFKIIKN